MPFLFNCFLFNQQCTILSLPFLHFYMFPSLSSVPLSQTILVSWKFSVTFLLHLSSALIFATHSPSSLISLFLVYIMTPHPSSAVTLHGHASFLLQSTLQLHTPIHSPFSSHLTLFSYLIAAFLNSCHSSFTSPFSLSHHIPLILIPPLFPFCSTPLLPPQV